MENDRHCGEIFLLLVKKGSNCELKRDFIRMEKRRLYEWKWRRLCEWFNWLRVRVVYKRVDNVRNIWRSLVFWVENKVKRKEQSSARSRCVLMSWEQAKWSVNGAADQHQLPEFGSDDFEKSCVISEKYNFAFLDIFHPDWSTIFQITANDDSKTVNGRRIYTPPLYDLFWFLTSFFKIWKRFFASVIKIISGIYG